MVTLSFRWTALNIHRVIDVRIRLLKDDGRDPKYALCLGASDQIDSTYVVNFCTGGGTFVALLQLYEAIRILSALT